jgi:hypothetical protein
MKQVTELLLQGPPWVRYRTLVDLLDRPENDPEVLVAWKAVLASPEIQALLSELDSWPGPPLKRHNEAGHLLHKLVFLSDAGIKAGDPGVDRVIQLILNNRTQDGMFRVLMNVSPHFGGTGQDQMVWMLCDAPSVLYALINMGLGDDPAVRTAAAYLAELSFEKGWPCAVSADLGKFRGPGRKTDPCPYATLVSLKALSRLPEWRDSPVCRTGAAALLDLWDRRKETKPYLFAMGTDFAKLKAPLVWYDILHIMEVLTQFPWLSGDKRMGEMADIIRTKADTQGCFTPESVYKSWAEWDFGQKKRPSPWLTLLTQRVLKRWSK